MKRVFYILFIIIFTLSSCVDDFEPGASSQYMDKIGYSISMAQDDEFKSRGSSTNSQVSVRKLDATIGGKDLYLHTVVSNNISQSVIAQKNAAAMSRGTITDSESIDEIAVSAIVINDSEAPKGWPATGDAQMYMNNEPVYKDYNWTTGRYWPQEQDSIRFYAYSPVGALDDESQDYTKGLPNMSYNEPGFYYRVSDVVADQQDLLVAAAQYKGNYCKPAQINMCHALTAVELKLSDEIEGFTIKHLSISGVENDGTYEYDFTPNLDECENSRDDGHWILDDLDNQQGEYILYDDEQGVELNGTQVSLGDNLVLMMMPQTLTDDATITVKGTDHITGLDITLTANIGDGPAWGKGQHVVYTLSFNPTRIEYVIEVTPTKELDANGRYFSPFHGESNINCTVRSFKRTTTPAEIIEEPLEWEIDASTLPAWIDHITLNGGDNAICTYSVLPNLTNSTSHNILKTQTPLGTEDAPWDLSRNAQYSEGAYPYETANCYIVTAPGWYTLPLVYGNAIRGGADNPASYLGDTYGPGPATNNDGNARAYFVSKTINGTTFDIPIKTLQKFIGSGEKIKSSWITDTNNRGGEVNPTGSKIIWQDEPCLVTDLHLNETKDYIIFKVPELSINEGNAIISLKSSGSTKWSWHIWVTDQIDRCNGNGDVSFANDITLTNRFVTSGFKENAQTPSEWGSYKESKFNVMPSNIGACDADTKTYTEETFDVTFKLLENGQEVAQSKDYVIRKEVLKVGVRGNTVSMTDNATYYQFGRIDPMIPGLGNGQDKPVYLDDRSAKKPISDGEYQDKFGIKKEGDSYIGMDNGEVSSITSISLGMVNLNPEYFMMGLINEPEEKYVTTVVYQAPGYISGNQDFFINQWDATFNDMPVYSHADISNAVDFYNALKKALGRSVVKTVYDPCPVGYEMPRFDVYTGFSFEGQNVSPFLIQDVSAAGYSIVDDVNLDNVYPSISTLVNSGTYQGLKFYTKTMPRRQAHSAADISSATNRIYIHALGHRNKEGIVVSYNHFANALTATPLCARWINENQLNEYYKFQGSRLCVIGKPNYSMRSISTSDFDLAFPIIPAKTGCNPFTVIVDNDNNVYWSDGNETNFSGSFN